MPRAAHVCAPLGVSPLGEGEAEEGAGRTGRARRGGGRLDGLGGRGGARLEPLVVVVALALTADDEESVLLGRRLEVELRVALEEHAGVALEPARVEDGRRQHLEDVERAVGVRFHDADAVAALAIAADRIRTVQVPEDDRDDLRVRPPAHGLLGVRHDPEEPGVSPEGHVVLLVDGVPGDETEGDVGPLVRGAQQVLGHLVGGAVHRDHTRRDGIADGLGDLRVLVHEVAEPLDLDVGGLGVVDALAFVDVDDEAALRGAELLDALVTRHAVRLDARHRGEHEAVREDLLLAQVVGGRSAGHQTDDLVGHLRLEGDAGDGLLDVIHGGSPESVPVSRLGIRWGLLGCLDRAWSERANPLLRKRLFSISHITGHFWPVPQEPIFASDGRSRSDTEVCYGGCVETKSLT